MRGLSSATIELIGFARELLAELHPMTLRQLHYAIFSAAKIEYSNTHRSYRRLGRVTTAARRSYRALELAHRADLLGSPDIIPPAWIVDETRETRVVSVWADTGEYLEAVKHSYRRNYWQTQSNYCEVWSEKATVLGSLRPVADDFGITVRNCKGYGSTGMESRIGENFETVGKPTTVLYLGDHDPSGRDIERDIYRRARTASGKDFTLERLAIHPEDIQLFNLPPQKIKNTDTRSQGFRKKFGAKAPTVELDALPVEELRRRVREAVEGLIDPEPWERQVQIEQVELNSIAEMAERMKNLPPAA